MRCSRFALGFTRNRKVAPLTDATFRLWVGAIDYSKENETDGLVAAAALSAIPRGPAGGGWRRAHLAELEAAGLFEPVEGGWLVHDYLDYQRSAGSDERSRERERERMRNVRSNIGATPGERSPEKPPLSGSPSLNLPDLSGSSDSERLPEDPTGGARETAKSRKAPARRWRRVPESWEPTVDHRQIASNLRLDFALELAKFRDHEFANPKQDADATFRNWLRAAKPAGGPAPGLQQYRAQQQTERSGPNYKLFPNEQAEARRARRRQLLAEAKEGKHGDDVRRRALSGRELGKLVDALEKANPGSIGELLGVASE